MRDLREVLANPGTASQLSHKEAAGALVELSVVQAALAARIASDPPSNQPAPAIPKLINARQVATRLGLSIRSVYALARAGKLPFSRRLAGRAIRFDEGGLVRFLERRARQSPNSEIS